MEFNQVQEALWTWEVLDESGSNVSGDLSKLFKSEHVKAPGAFAKDEPQHDATILCREAIQNSWDAARALRTRMPGDAPPFEVVFRFETLLGVEKEQLLSNLGLRELEQRAETQQLRTLGLGHEGCLDFDGEEPLRILEVIESGTTGMYGPWKNGKSKMYAALLSAGISAKEQGSGGSYGYGKAGLIRGSAPRCLVAYTCFREEAGEPGVTRRLLGMTYWGQHQVEGLEYTGFARYGKTIEEGRVEPFVNEEADEAAERLGLNVRDVQDADQLGTTFLLIGPTIAPDDLKRAAERNWWPALLQPNLEFDITVIDEDNDTELEPRPRKDSLLAPFIRSWEIATTPQDNKVELERRHHLRPYEHKASGGKLEVGNLGMVAQPGSWSFPDAGDDTDHKSLVALVRSPNMVVEYYETGNSSPYVRGCFVADNDIDDLLRQTEPKAHDAWETQEAEDGIDEQAPHLARRILSAIYQQLHIFRRELRPPTRDRREIRLPDYENLMRDLLTGQAGTRESPPPSKPHEVSLTLTDERHDLAPDGERIVLCGSVRAELTDVAESDMATVLVTVSAKFDEDGRAGEKIAVAVTPPSGFEQSEDGSLKGELRRGTPVEFTYRSEPYETDWSAFVVARADIEELA